MSDLLATTSAVFRDLALPGTLVVLDFDGTLARIARDHRQARLSARSRRALTRLAERYPVAILSGRSARDLRQRVDGVPVRWVVGNHGADWPGEPAAQAAWVARVRDWKRRLAAGGGGLGHLELEDKGVSLTLHLGGLPARGRRAILTVAATLPGARPIPGKRVLNLLPEEAPDKGTALWRLAADTGAGRVFFAGDDETDEVAFRARLPVPAVTVRVGYHAGTAARFHVRRRSDVDGLLLALAALRDPRSRLGGDGAS